MRPALVISLDFELMWGVRDTRRREAYRPNLLGVRAALPRLLELFASYGAHATWATVGFLFCRDRDDLRAHVPSTRPRYRDARLDPYAALEREVGPDEARDPLHFAPSLIARIRETPGQELATHTLSHYYCMEPGQDAAMFRADLEGAITLGRRDGVALRSLVFPRNQVRADYLPICRELGIVAYRGNGRSPLYRGGSPANEPRARRLGRLVDAYLPLQPEEGCAWEAIAQGAPHDVPASRFLRPIDRRLAALEPLRLLRIERALERAARTGRVYHLWWHPHNFGRETEANLRFLRRVLDRFVALRDRYGLRSLTMAEAAAEAAAARGNP